MELEMTGQETGTNREIALIGGGCFWCIEAVLERLEGVSRVVSGYAGGKNPSPSYEQVCSGATGHAEVVQVEFDPAVLSYRDLLIVFFAMHDPTTLNRQGADVGTQYRSVIYYNSDTQRQVAEALIREFDGEGIWGAPIVTKVEAAPVFYPAEQYHQQYYQRNPGAGYCQVVIAPKVAKLRQKFAHRLRGAGAGA
jgi:peptide-methionine (S)-S-oxide reductase